MPLEADIQEAKVENDRSFDSRFSVARWRLVNNTELANGGTELGVTSRLS